MGTPVRIPARGLRAITWQDVERSQTDLRRQVVRVVAETLGLSYGQAYSVRYAPGRYEHLRVIANAQEKSK